MIKEGSVVVVTAQMDERVRESDEQRIGTAISVTTSDVWVLFPSGIIWVGPKRDVFLETVS